MVVPPCTCPFSALHTLNDSGPVLDCLRFNFIHEAAVDHGTDHSVLKKVTYLKNYLLCSLYGGNNIA